MEQHDQQTRPGGGENPSPPSPSETAPPPDPGVPLPPPAYHVPPQPGPQWNGKTNGLSITGVVTAMFGCVFGVVGMAFGIAGIVQSRRNGDRRGRNYGIAAVIISGLYMIGFLGLAGVAIFRDVTDPVRDDAGVLRGERSVEVTDLRAGDCVVDLDAQKGSRVDAVPCSAAHSSEVVGVFRIPAGTTDRITAAQEGCESRYQSYTGADVPADDAEPSLYVADVVAAGYDEPDVLCFSHRDSGPTSGSVKK